MDNKSGFSFIAAARALCAVGCVLASTGAWSQTVDCLATGTAVSAIRMRVLLVAADGNEAVLPAIRSTLDHLGVPYDLVLAKDQLLAPELLCSASGGVGLGNYQGVILATGNLAFFNATSGQYESALSAEEWTRLWQYEAKYRVRQVTMYTVPGGFPDTYGLTAPTPLDTSGTPLSTTLTASVPAGSTDPSGRQVFAYLQPTAPVLIRDAYTYLSKPAAGSAVTPLLVDAGGNAIASIASYSDGRKNLTLTADGNPYLLHTLSLGYGIVNWVTRGLYVGQRRVLMSAQPDDLLIADDMWDPATNRDDTGKTYRVTASDYNRFISWQTNRNRDGRSKIRIEMPFNGVGATTALPRADLYPRTTDDLSPRVRAANSNFDWLSHTYDHENLDALTYTQVLDELNLNHTIATSTLRLGSYSRDSLVTPEISGLNNAEAMRAMRDFGIRYLVSDTSKFCGHRDAVRAAQFGCPLPNHGIYHDLQTSILMIPRYPSNLFYNVSTPAEWVSEYNFLYRSFWGRDLSYAEILDKESAIWLRYLLSHDYRPLMFHQPNLRAYEGTASSTRSLLGDLIDATLAKYYAIYTVGAESRRQPVIGALMAERVALYKAVSPASGPALGAWIHPGAATSSIVITNPTAAATTVPITGLDWTGASSRESYGGQSTIKVLVNVNGSVTVPNAPAW